jgi:hypothetical protein
MKAAASDRVRASSTGWRSGLRVVSKDGVITGAAGAAAVSIVFLLLDFAQGRPFFTPSLLGSAIFQGQLLTETSAPDPTMIFAYTGLHVIAFLLVGFLLAGLYRELEEHPKLGIELLVVLLVFQGLLMGAEVTVFPALVGELGAWAVATANVASLVAMFAVLAYRHPETIKSLRESE